MLFLTACYRYSFTDVEYSETEFANENGWEIVSLIVYCSVYDEELGEDVTGAKYHYNNVGHLKFNIDGTGVYSYDEIQYNFEWSISSTRINISFDIDEVTDYTAPFVYYSLFGSDFNDPYLSESSSANTHNLSRLTENSFLCSKSNAEFIINKVL
ncbi:MAG: hypothetical protein C0596_11620 [Marinilabiliales bacterium]|nr:MAG: hypothetical protein C0596_11620 [Marinilabiliales bacterium]